MIYVFIVTYKGKYRVINYKKYKGDPTGVVYRSLWERKFMKWCDTNPNVGDGGQKKLLYHIKIQFDGKVASLLSRLSDEK